MTPDGWTLRFTGPQAKDALIERVMDEIEQIFGPD
jgi:ParB family chromosome partitioning protein